MSISACPKIPKCDPCTEELVAVDDDACCPNKGKCVKITVPQCAEGEAPPDADGNCLDCMKADVRKMSSHPNCKKTITCCVRSKLLQVKYCQGI